MAWTFSGFDWDEGNWPKFQKHGLSKMEVEDLFGRPFLIVSAR